MSIASVQSFRAAVEYFGTRGATLDDDGGRVLNSHFFQGLTPVMLLMARRDFPWLHADDLANSAQNRVSNSRFVSFPGPEAHFGGFVSTASARTLVFSQVVRCQAIKNVRIQDLTPIL